MPPEKVNDQALRANPYRALTGRALFSALLEPGQRSTCFIDSSPLNRDFRTKGHEVRFFYLMTDARRTIARVEVPAWIAEDETRLGRVHAAILDQCPATGGFPYVLVRAHELAVITQQDRDQLEGMTPAASPASPAAAAADVGRALPRRGVHGAGPARTGSA